MMLVSLISRLEGGMRKNVVWIIKMSLKIFKLICLRTNNSFFSLLGVSKILSFGEFDESKNSLDF